VHAQINRYMINNIYRIIYTNDSLLIDVLQIVRCYANRILEPLQFGPDEFSETVTKRLHGQKGQRVVGAFGERHQTE